MSVQLESDCISDLLATFVIRLSLEEEIRTLYNTDEELNQGLQKLQIGEALEFRLRDDGLLVYKDIIYIPNQARLKEAILEEAHSSAYAMHPGSTKIYRTINENYWWPGMKREIAEYIAKCLIFQQIKVEHQKPARTL